MKKIMGLILALAMLGFMVSGIPLLSSASADDIVLQCENGTITGGAADLMNSGKVSGYGESKLVCMDGTGAATKETKATLISFSNVQFAKDGNYKFILSYDATNDATRKVDLLVDGKRYSFPVDKSDWTSEYGSALYYAEVAAPVKAGTHTISVATPVDFYNGTSTTYPCVKSVNADSLTISYDSALSDTYILECEDLNVATITGECAEHETNYHIQTGQFGGATVVGMSGDSNYPTMGSTITFQDVNIATAGTYRLILSYDAASDSTKKVDILVDGMRYHFPIQQLLIKDWRLGLYNTEVVVSLTAGKHTFAITTPEDFNRTGATDDPNVTVPVVKCINADCLTIQKSIVRQCESGTITGAAAKFTDPKNNIQVGGGIFGATVVGMSGNGNTGITEASTITFDKYTDASNNTVDNTITVPTDGYYNCVLAYDASNDTNKKADLLVDGVRYNFPIPTKAYLPSATKQNTYYATVTVPLKAGTHIFAVTTSLDFNRDTSDPSKYVKSVNADYLAVTYSSSFMDAYFNECEDGVISGESHIYETNNHIQTGQYGGATVVGISGSSDCPTMASTITFPNVNVTKDGNYKFILSYDASNDSLKKVDLLVDGVRYNFPVPGLDGLPGGWRLGLYNVSVRIPLSAGVHTFAVTTSVDFDRNGTPVVKSVNADSLTVVLGSTVSSTENYTASPAVIQTPTKIMFTDFNNMVRFEKGVDTYNKTDISPDTYKDYYADNYNGVPTVNTATLSIVDGKGVDASKALSIQMPHQDTSNDNIGVNLYASSINNMPTSIKGAKYLVLWVDFTGVDFRKACFGVIGNDLTLYRTDELDDRTDLNFYVQDGSGGWTKKVHGTDGCFGVKQDTSLLNYKGYMAIPISDFGSCKDKTIFDPETQDIAGVYFYFDYNGVSYANKPFYFDNIQFLADFNNIIDTTPTTSSTTTTAAPATTTATSATTTTVTPATTITEAPATTETESTEAPSAELYTITGQLVSNGKPVANATLELHSTIQTAMTDANGYFTFSNVEAGSHTLSVTSGSVTGTVSFEIVVDDTVASPTLSEDGSTILVPSLTNALSIQFSLADSGDLTVAKVLNVIAPAASTTATKGSSPQTGDATTSVYIVIFVMSLMVFAALKYGKKMAFVKDTKK